MTTYRFKAVLSNNQTGIASGVQTPVDFDTVVIDEGAFWDSANKVLVPPAGANVQFVASVALQGAASPENVRVIYDTSGNCVRSPLGGDMQAVGFDTADGTTGYKVDMKATNSGDITIGSNANQSHFSALIHVND